MNRMFGAQKPQNPPPQQPGPQQPFQPPQEPAGFSNQSAKLEQKIQELNVTIQDLEKQVAEMYKKMKASKGGTQNMYKQRVQLLLKKKKMYNDQLSNLLSNQFMIDKMAFTKENIQTQLEATAAMQQATQVQKQLMEKIDIDQLEDLRDQMDELQWQQKEMDDVMNRDYAVDVDEDDLDAEMRDIEDELFQEALMSKQQQQMNQQQQQQQPQYMQSNVQQQQQFNPIKF